MCLLLVSQEMLIPIILTIILGAFFYIVDGYNETIKIHPSLISGFSIAYFFLVVLPEISTYLPEELKHFPALEYFVNEIWVLGGF